MPGKTPTTADVTLLYRELLVSLSPSECQFWQLEFQNYLTAAVELVDEDTEDDRREESNRITHAFYEKVRLHLYGFPLPACIPTTAQHSALNSTLQRYTQAYQTALAQAERPTADEGWYASLFGPAKLPAIKTLEKIYIDLTLQLAGVALPDHQTLEQYLNGIVQDPELQDTSPLSYAAQFDRRYAALFLPTPMIIPQATRQAILQQLIKLYYQFKLSLNFVKNKIIDPAAVVNRAYFVDRKKALPPQLRTALIEYRNAYITLLEHTYNTTQINPDSRIVKIMEALLFKQAQSIFSLQQSQYENNQDELSHRDSYVDDEFTTHIAAQFSQQWLAPNSGHTDSDLEQTFLIDMKRGLFHEFFLGSMPTLEQATASLKDKGSGPLQWQSSVEITPEVVMQQLNKLTSRKDDLNKVVIRALNQLTGVSTSLREYLMNHFKVSNADSTAGDIIAIEMTRYVNVTYVDKILKIECVLSPHFAEMPTDGAPPKISDNMPKLSARYALELETEDKAGNPVCRKRRESITVISKDTPTLRLVRPPSETQEVLRRMGYSSF